MSRRRSGPPMEQDSFLDIVANLVGILIILVVVFGAQIGQTLSSKASPEMLEAEAALTRQRESLQRYQVELQQRAAEHDDWERSSLQQDGLIQQRRLERHLAMQQLQTIKIQVEERTSALSQEQQAEVRLRQELARQTAEIEQKKKTLQTIRLAAAELVEEEESPEAIIEHYPTPIAQTVFGQEVHFQLRDNRLVWVPFDELVQRLRASWETHAENLPVGRTTTETLGPIANFRLQYELISQEKPVPTANGMVTTRVVSLQRFWLLPVQAGLGEDVETALQPSSELMSVLKKYPPADTTLSIWVYPESYALFLDLRKMLTKRGYRVAVWPLTSDQRISGSPDGLRATAQ